ncbi:MAG: GNAT family N-acetyltransferase [Pseudonocardiaceae bacterium]
MSALRATPTTPAHGAGDLAVRVLPSSARVQAGEAWRAIEATAPDVPPFARWDWTQLWLDHFGDVVPHVYVIVERGGVPRGTVLLTRSTRSRGPLSVRRMHLGTAGEPANEGVFVEYNGLCAHSANRTAVARALLSHVHRTGGWDELHLDGFDPEAAAPLLAAEPRFTVEQRCSRVLDLDQAPGDLVDALGSKSARAAVRRSLRGISPYTTEWAYDCESANAILDDLERLHQERWRARGEPGAFASTRFCSFHRRLVERWLPEGRAVVFAVRQDGATVAALYGFVAGGTLQFYQGGFHMFENNKVRAGYAAHLLLAGAARERGLTGYEYLAGDHRYKTELSTSERTLVWAILIRRRPRALAISAARRARQALRALRQDGSDHTSADGGA